MIQADELNKQFRVRNARNVNNINGFQETRQEAGDRRQEAGDRSRRQELVSEYLEMCFPFS